jgi:hypothetical protein
MLMRIGLVLVLLCSACAAATARPHWREHPDLSKRGAIAHAVLVRAGALPAHP